MGLRVGDYLEIRTNRPRSNEALPVGRFKLLPGFLAIEFILECTHCKLGCGCPSFQMVNGEIPFEAIEHVSRHIEMCEGLFPKTPVPTQNRS